jgi:hypothetical protein
MTETNKKHEETRLTGQDLKSSDIVGNVIDTCISVEFFGIKIFEYKAKNFYKDIEEK